MRVIRQNEAIRVTGLSRTTLWRLERAGQFPPRRRLGRNSIGWLQGEIEAWMKSRPRGFQSSKQDTG